MADIRKDLKEGCVASFYSQTKFCKVKPALNIDRVDFAFVRTGTGGNGFDIFVDADSFDLLCDQILSGSFVTTLAKDTGDYPSAWEYVTGDNGEKHIAIGKGKDKPIVIQGRIDGLENGNIFIGINAYDDLRLMAKWWRRASADYYAQLTKALQEGMKKNDSYHTENATEETPAGSAVKEEKTTDKTESVSSIEGGTQKIYKLIPIEGIGKASNYTDDKPCYTVRCLEKDSGNEVEVVFLSKYIAEDTQTFNQLLDVLSSGRRPPFRVEAIYSTYKGQQQLRFLKFPPAEKGA